MQYGSLTLAEDTPVGHTLMTIKASDADEPDTGSSFINFHISAGDNDKVFTVETDGSGIGYLVIAKVNNPHPIPSVIWGPLKGFFRGGADILNFASGQITASKRSSIFLRCGGKLIPVPSFSGILALYRHGRHGQRTTGFSSSLLFNQKTNKHLLVKLKSWTTLNI